MIRNLYFYLYPVIGSIWPWHIEKLRRYASVFNGRRVIFLSVDERTDSPDVVAESLNGLNGEVHVVENDPALREARAFLPALKILESNRSDEITFYAHGKGVTHSGNVLENVRAWSEGMYYLNLERPDIIDRLMEKYDAVGAFRWPIVHGGGDWHYSGAYYWFKHSAVFSKNWQDMWMSYYGVEGYIGRHIPIERSFAFSPYTGNFYDRCPKKEEYEIWLKDAAILRDR